MKTKVVAAAALTLILSAAAPALAQAPGPLPSAQEIEKLLAQNPLAEGRAFRIDEIARTESASVHLAQIRGADLVREAGGQVGGGGVARPPPLAPRPRPSRRARARGGKPTPGPSS